ncbi:hypothetical protein MKW92_018854, partial [Papaver armeniacum]
AQRIKHIIALCRNVEDTQPSSRTLQEVAWKLENYHRNELLAEFGEISQEPSQSLTNQRENSQHVAESEDIEQRGVRRSIRPHRPIQRDVSLVYKRKKIPNRYS